MNITIPVHELVFFSAAIIWALFRFIYFRVDENKDQFHFPQFYTYNLILEKYNPYYKNLSEAARKKFVNRTYLIGTDLIFQGKEGFIINDEEKILTCGCIAQLTFGFPEPHIPNLKGVIIYPSIFYSQLSDAWVKGLATGNGFVFLSWEDFVRGYEPDTATYNLGLHEFAHILRLSVNDSHSSNFRLFHYYDDWENYGATAFEKTRNAEQNFFREYGGTNQAEFFSVCIENFFEVPEAFSQHYPEVYWHLCYLMQQNPMNIKADYTFDRDETMEANDYVENEMPVLTYFVSDFEYTVWQKIGRNKNDFILPFFISISLILIDYHVASIFRMTIGSLLIGLLIRAYSFRGFKFLSDKEYYFYLFSKSFPAALMLASFYQVFFGST